jgi:uncharacterized membrane protein YkvA (DUF1232 family)
MITICLLILLFSILKRPVGKLTRMLRNVDWKRLAQGIRSKIVDYSRRAGRAGARVVLRFYYTLQEGDLSTTEKAMVYAGIIYIVVPRDLLPRKLLGLFGALDDVGVAAWIIDRIGKRITPEIERKVEDTLDKWFGPVVTISYPE